MPASSTGEAPLRLRCGHVPPISQHLLTTLPCSVPAAPIFPSIFSQQRSQREVEQLWAPRVRGRATPGTLTLLHGHSQAVREAERCTGRAQMSPCRVRLLAGFGSASSPPPAAVALPDGAASPHGTRAGQGKRQQRGGSGVAGCHRCGTEGKQGEARGASQAAAQQRAGRRRNSQLQKQTRSLPASTGEAGLPQQRA